jgi:murein L,D-transpeptidase YafK
MAGLLSLPTNTRKPAVPLSTYALSPVLICLPDYQVASPPRPTNNCAGGRRFPVEPFAEFLPVRLPAVLTTLAITSLIVTVVLNRGPMPDRILPPPDPGPELTPEPEAVTKGDDPQRAAVAAELLKPQLTRDLAAMGLKFGEPVFVRIFKEELLLEIWVRPEDEGTYQLFRSYPVAGMSGNSGPKLAEGDLQAPEGFYFVQRGQMNPNSKYHLSFDLGYPNAYDAAHQRTGSALMVHGNRVSAGCYAMTDARIEEIYTLCDAALRNGQPFFRVHCFPFRMGAERMMESVEHRWFPFWRNLREGYDLFEENRVPPNTTVQGQRYQFD